MDAKVEMLKRLGDTDPVVACKTYRSLETMGLMFTAPGKSVQREDLARFLAAELNATDPGGVNGEGNKKPPVPRYSIQVRRQIARLLGYVNGPAQVPALAEAMKDLELREAARCALARNPSDEATDALLAALNEIGPEFRVGLVGSLGNRRGDNVVKRLQMLVEDFDPRVQRAAADALAGIPEPSNDLVLSALSRKSCRPVDHSGLGPAARCSHPDCQLTRQAAHKARVRLAETLARSGNRAAARKICQDILHGEAGEAHKKAAKIALESMP